MMSAGSVAAALRRAHNAPQSGCNDNSFRRYLAHHPEFADVLEVAERGVPVQGGGCVPPSCTATFHRSNLLQPSLRSLMNPCLSMAYHEEMEGRGGDANRRVDCDGPRIAMAS
eukprot:TRINITY_DN1532_c0_g1_i1.p4 TRINITY_DN1532_c0_g1~~TRINITY_DN1532_c0_g1_i1.p4  ORF type:complete len:113 (-),score=2.43 TRINITY_DN1532_c0_g1_i1:1392-1730(-)